MYHPFWPSSPFMSHHVEYEGRPPVKQLQHEPRVPTGGHLPHLLPGAAGDTRLTHGSGVTCHVAAVGTCGHDRSLESPHSEVCTPPRPTLNWAAQLCLCLRCTAPHCTVLYTATTGRPVALLWRKPIANISFTCHSCSVEFLVQVRTQYDDIIDDDLLYYLICLWSLFCLSGLLKWKVKIDLLLQFVIELVIWAAWAAPLLTFKWIDIQFQTFHSSFATIRENGSHDGFQTCHGEEFK